MKAVTFHEAQSHYVSGGGHAENHVSLDKVRNLLSQDDRSLFLYILYYQVLLQLPSSTVFTVQDGRHTS